MSEITNIFARNVKDLTSPSGITELNKSLFNAVKLVAGNFPASYANCEALTIADIYNICTLSLQEQVTASLENKADKQYVDFAFAGLNAYNVKFYPTLTAGNADIANVSVNQPIWIGEATTGGLYYKSTANATTLTKTPNDPLTQAKSYTDGLVKSKALGTADLNTILTEGLYSQPTASNATAERNYPSHAQNTASSMRVIAMTSNTIMQIIEALGKTSIRMIYSASTAPNYQAWSTTLGTSDKLLIDSSIAAVDTSRKELAIWSVSGTNGKVTFNKSTKVLNWNNAIIAAFNRSTRRIQVPAASFTFVNAYDTLFLDLSQVPNDGNVTAELLSSCLKIAKYGDSAATAFTHKSTQLPLAQLNPQGEIVRCPGFIDIDSGGKVKDTFSYNKVTDRINFYLPASNGNLINYLLRHDVKAFDGTSSQSQLDMWRLERAIEVDANYTTLQEIVTYGEWEFTMREKDFPADHVGGVHGDEVLTSAYFLVDGVYKDPLTWTGSGEAKEIRLQMQSVIYRLNTQTTIADHYKELIITKNGITANQWVKNRILFNPDRFWLAMLPTNRVAANSVQVSTRDIRDGVARDVTGAGFTQVYTPLKNSSYVNVSGDKYSTSVEISNLQGVLETADVYVANDAAYNKIYVSAIGGASSGVTLPAGTKISWTTKYKVDVL